jgi:hypothetical protein
VQAYTSYLWHQFNLHGRKALIVILLSISFVTIAQPPPQKSYKRYKPKIDINLPFYDDRLLHYGFFLALNYNRLNINQSDYFIDSHDIKTVTPTATVGFSLGFLLNIRIADQLSFKIIPSVGFYDRDLTYTYYNKSLDDHSDGNDTLDVKVTETTFIETSFLLKYKSVRRNNHRFYLIGGLKPSIRAGGKKPDASNKVIGFGRYDLTIEYGFGVDLYFQYFKFAPELRFSHGLVNMNTGDNNPWNNSLQSMYTHTVTLYFFFE